MEDLSGAPVWISVAGAVIAWPALKYIWPVIRDSLAAQGGQWRAENHFLEQLKAELKDVKSERDATRQQANALVMQVAGLEAQVKILTQQLEMATEQLKSAMGQLHVANTQIEELRREVRIVQGASQ